MPANLLKIHGVAETAVTKAIHMANDAPDAKIMRTGAYLTIVNRHTQQVVLQVLIGAGPPEKVAKWRQLSAEKCVRLLGHQPYNETSFESRSPENNRWGGAVLGTDYVFGLSGLDELGDEAAMFLVAIKCDQCDRNATLGRISKERNPQLRHFLDKIHWTE